MNYDKHDSVKFKAIGHVSAKCVVCLDSRRSLIVYVFKFYGNTVSWNCNLQDVVSSSTIENECIIVVEAIKDGTEEASWMRDGKTFNGKAKCKKGALYDSQSNIQLARNQVCH